MSAQFQFTVLHRRSRLCKNEVNNVFRFHKNEGENSILAVTIYSL